ncbi:DUF3108 domain-containing protein [Aliiglaciecola sp. CAU 1673]|uniref:DUF3108 domain-containing protein n=1 Tax=Aliiglaciecola sp. CAU 1673 TaxID=3032595 RepID=UPI0023DC4E64|nr:DUF3108 domain-containing protein [Aliiglaciecola sp. CAU 1673]MDF2177569.1 DUF3108 domain-containing protein [Aliiglaciecola sp. CAU 1673]
MSESLNKGTPLTELMILKMFGLTRLGAKVLLGSWMLLFSASILALELSPYQAEYVAYRSGMTLGEAKQQLSHLGRCRYKLTYQSDASFLFLSDHRKEESLFSVNDDRIIPYKYSFQRTGTGKDKTLNLLFDNQSQKILVENDNSLPWQGEIDNQLYQLLVRDGLASGETEFSFRIINDRGELREQSFRVLGKETLSLPYGKLDTLKLEKVRENSSRETYIWLAPSLDYLMVRLLQLKDGSEQGDIQLQRYQLLAPSAQPEPSQSP